MAVLKDSKPAAGRKAAKDPVLAKETLLRRRAPWWLSPAGIAIGFLLPMFCLVSVSVEFDMQGMTARGIHFLTPAYLALGVGIILTMACGGWIGSQVQLAHRRPAMTRDIDFAALLIGGLGLIAYVIWFREYLVSPAKLWAILSGATQPSRGDQLVAGVTSLANGGPVFFSIYTWRRVYRGDEPLARWMTPLCVALGCLTAFRVFAWSERLALIEAVLPVSLLLAIAASTTKWPPLKFLIRFGPFVALPLLMLYFGLAESVRSWTSDTYNGKIEFWDFVIGRMATYYYTALNNGAGLLATQTWPTFEFAYTGSMLHTAPLSLGPLFSSFVGYHGPQLDTFLTLYGDPEFNNPSGLYTVILDLGIPLGLLYFAVAGFAAGILFKLFAKGSLSGALLYPMFFISYLEVFRYPYLGTGRAFAWAICVLLVLLAVHHGRFYVRYGGWRPAATT